MIKKVFFFFLLLFFSTGCGEISTYPSQNSNLTEDTLTINAYFSQTSGNYNLGGGMDEYLINDILNAKSSINLAIYSLTNDRIRDALIKAHQKGVDVKIFTDDREFFKDDMKVLKSAGIFVANDENTNALMHNKFMIIDKKRVWSGSCNYTYYAFYRNNENLVKMNGFKIAEVYEEQFRELLEGTYVEKAYVSDGIEIYFSPEDDFQQRLLSLIEGARYKIDFLAFAFTDKSVADAIIKKAASGVTVRGVMDEKQNAYQSSSVFKYLKSSGISVKLDKNKFTMHDKVFIIDDTVVTGSYNFTKKANDTNNENSIVVHNADFSKLYEREFKKIYEKAN